MNMKVGITGHQKLNDPSAWSDVCKQLGELLNDAEKPLIGLTSLAIGADQLFAEVVLGRVDKIWEGCDIWAKEAIP